MSASKIAALNDQLRKSLGMANMKHKVLLTRALSSLDKEKVQQALNAVRTFNDFTEDNDPYGEHDFAFIELPGFPEKIAFKIDYYDSNLEYLSDDPASDIVTTRVMTVMLASDR